MTSLFWRETLLACIVDRLVFAVNTRRFSIKCVSLKFSNSMYLNYFMEKRLVIGRVTNFDNNQPRKGKGDPTQTRLVRDKGMIKPC